MRFENNNSTVQPCGEYICLESSIILDIDDRQVTSWEQCPLTIGYVGSSSVDMLEHLKSHLSTSIYFYVVHWQISIKMHKVAMFTLMGYNVLNPMPTRNWNRPQVMSSNG